MEKLTGNNPDTLLVERIEEKRRDEIKTKAEDVTLNKEGGIDTTCLNKWQPPANLYIRELTEEERNTAKVKYQEALRCRSVESAKPFLMDYFSIGEKSKDRNDFWYRAQEALAQLIISELKITSTESFRPHPRQGYYTLEDAIVSCVFSKRESGPAFMDEGMVKAMALEKGYQEILITLALIMEESKGHPGFAIDKLLEDYEKVWADYQGKFAQAKPPTIMLTGKELDTSHHVYLGAIDYQLTVVNLGTVERNLDRLSHYISKGGFANDKVEIGRIQDILDTFFRTVYEHRRTYGIHLPALALDMLAGFTDRYSEILDENGAEIRAEKRHLMDKL